MSLLLLLASLFGQVFSDGPVYYHLASNHCNSTPACCFAVAGLADRKNTSATPMAHKRLCWGYIEFYIGIMEMKMDMKMETTV